MAVQWQLYGSKIIIDKRSAIFIWYGQLVAYESILSGVDDMLFFRNKKKWKLYLYLNNLCIKKLCIKENENPSENIYVINIWFKKFLFGTNHTKIIIRPTKIIYTNEKKKETHWEFEYEKGIDI